MDIYANNKDINGKTKKKKNILPGKCIFPVKYKKKEYNKCIEGKNGNWCATSLTKKGYTKTWGYCIEKKYKKTKKKKSLSIIKSSLIIDSSKINKLFLNKEIRIKIIKQILSGKYKISNIKTNYPFTLEDSKIYGKILKKNKPCDILSFLYKKKEQIRFMSNEKGQTGFPYHVCIDNCKDHKGEFVVKILPYVKDNDFINSTCKKKRMVINKKIQNYNERESKSISECIESDSRRPEHIENKLLYLFSNFVYNNNSPHFTLPIMTFQCKMTDILKNYEGSEKSAYLQGIKHNVYIDKCIVILAEWANGGDLKKFIRSNIKKWFQKGERYCNKIWGVIYFQFLQMLICIFDKYPNFRHNDLKVDNILVSKKNIKENQPDKYYLYKIGKKKFVIPDLGFQLKLWDFDLSNIDNKIDNYKTDDMEEYGIRKTRNQYYDMHSFLNYLRLYVIGGEYRHFITKKVSNFWRRIIPVKYRYDEHLPEVYWGRIIDDIEITTPIKALKYELSKSDGIFNQFLKTEREIKEIDFIKIYEI